MKHKIWNMNQNYAARTIANKELSKTKDTLMLGQRATLYTQYRKEHSTISHHEDVLVSKQSKFEQLKKEIKKLENSQFLCMKNRCNTEPDNFQDLQFRLTGKEFMPSKKIATLEKYKMHLRKKGRTRKISLLLDRTQPEQTKDPHMSSFLQVKDVNIAQNNHRESNLKKKQTPSIVRKYYRPQTGVNHRSMSELGRKENEVRGRGLRSSATNRGEKGKEKENILIYCF